MTANRVLVVRVPAGWARAEDLPELAEYVGNAIVDGVLVLGESVRLELMELPPLGAVEVDAGNAVPVVIGGPRPTPEGGGGGLVVGGRVVRSVPDSGTAPEPEREDETNPKSINSLPESEKTPKTDLSNRTVFRAPDDAQKRKASAKRTLPMSAGEIVRSYKQAAKPEEQIGILAELNACTVDEIREILLQLGVELPKAKKRQPGRPKKGSV